MHAYAQWGLQGKAGTDRTKELEISLNELYQIFMYYTWLELSQKSKK